MNRIFQLVNGKVWCGFCQIDDYGAMLYEDEQRLMKGCSDKRIQEFSTARTLARTLIAKFGKTKGSIMPDRHGAPVWPAGIAGSISHSWGVCFVAVCNGTNCSIGIDVQKIMPLDDEFISMILTRRERAGIRNLDINTAANIMFSAKESAYKCLQNNASLYLDFHDVDVALEAGVFTANISHMNLKMEGIYRLYGAYIYTGIFRAYSFYNEC